MIILRRVLSFRPYHRSPRSRYLYRLLSRRKKKRSSALPYHFSLISSLRVKKEYKTIYKKDYARTRWIADERRGFAPLRGFISLEFFRVRRRRGRPSLSVPIHARRKLRCVRTRSAFQRSTRAALVETHAFVCVFFLRCVYVRLSRFLMKYVERISSRIIRIHYETHFESQGKDFARKRMFWYREISHKHDIIVPHSSHAFFLSLSFFSHVFNLFAHL